MARTQRHGVVVGADFRPPSGAAITKAARLATRAGGPAALHVVYSAQPASDGACDAIARQVPEELLLFARTYGCRGIERPTDLALVIHVRFGEPADVLRQLAADVSASAIVIGPRTDPAEPLGPIARSLLGDPNRPIFVAGVTHTMPFTEGHAIYQPACLDCSEVRRVSHGERWFCEAHAPAHASAHRFARTLVRHWTSWSPRIEGARVF